LEDNDIIRLEINKCSTTIQIANNIGSIAFELVYRQIDCF